MVPINLSSYPKTRASRRRCRILNLSHPALPHPAVIDEAAETRARLLEVQRTAADLTKDLLKDYIWQREAFKLEITKEDGTELLFLRPTS